MTTITAQRAPHSASNFAPTVEANAYGMNDRIKRLRQETFEAEPSLSIERALIETRFYKENYGKYPIPILRAMNFYEICKQKTIYIGKDELIVGERGPKPKCVPTFPELTCHSVEDLHVLNTRELQRYTISQEDIDTYEREVIPYWKGRTQRERIFSHVPQEWKDAYEVGMFTEFMEQRAPGHTALDGKVYKYGLLDLKERIRKELDGLDFMNDPEATDKQEELTARNRLLQKTYQKEAERRKTEEQNRLLNMIQNQTAGQLELLSQLMDELERTESREHYDRILGKIVVVGTYLKRRKNLVLTQYASDGNLLTMEDLRQSLAESCDSLKLCRIRAAYYVENADVQLNAEDILKCYDTFEWLVERLFDTMQSVFYRVSQIDDALRISVHIVAEADLRGLMSERPELDVQQEDENEWFIRCIVFRKRGGR